MEVVAPARSFRDLRVWQEAYQLSLNIYKTSEFFPKYEYFGLRSQMTRAAVSICSNIAEGFGRSGPKEKDYFYAIARGSATELENQLLIAQGVNYLENSVFTDLMTQCSNVHKMLYGLQKANSMKY